MAGLSFTALFIRFVLGGSAVLLSTLVSRRAGEKVGGIFAAFPAVYLAALLTTALDFSGEELISHSILLSKGAIIGMGINIFIALLAGYLLPRQGWKRGIMQAMGCWALVSMMVVFLVN